MPLVPVTASNFERGYSRARAAKNNAASLVIFSRGARTAVGETPGLAAIGRNPAKRDSSHCFQSSIFHSIPESRSNPDSNSASNGGFARSSTTSAGAPARAK